MVRLARANTITFARREFVLAARAMGATRLRLLARELLPNVALPVISLAVVMVSVLIVAESSLSFLGLGISPPQPTWGNMIAEGQNGVMEAHPMIVVIPGVCLFLTVFGLNLLGERAQKRWDPRSVKL
jgi:peptide/nickel transport system permease protein